MAEITGLSHLTLTVTDVKATTTWWSDLIGLQTLFGGVEDGIEYTVNMHSSGLIMGFRAHEKGDAGDRFDETRVGLDHFALQVASRDEIEKWAARLDEPTPASRMSTTVRSSRSATPTTCKPSSSPCPAPSHYVVGVTA